MAMETKTLNERQMREMELIKNSRFLTIRQISELLHVSEMTIRRDVLLLSQKKLVNQVYGGVVSMDDADKAGEAYSIDEEIRKNNALKFMIAQSALSLIATGDVVFFDSGTTVQFLAEQLPSAFACTAISSSFTALCALTKLNNTTTIIPGGVFSHKSKVFYDSESIKTINRYRANIAFIGVTGYELEMGLTCGYVEDMPLKQAMIKASKKKVLLFDSSKCGRVSTCAFAKINEFTTVITDAGIPEAYAEQIKENGVELIVV